jgi:hypothetical protein
MNDATTDGSIKYKMTEEGGIKLQCNEYEQIPEKIMGTYGRIADRSFQKTGSSTNEAEA